MTWPGISEWEMPVILEIKLCRMMMTLFLSAEFSQAQNLNRRCVLRGGTCFYRTCPPFIKTFLGRCSKGGVCCGRGL
ncbi:hypothetical protein G0U57_017745 [Chelydra serpentina]|uniref:Beta-defensin-like domain-containing protein n=1 Tax=Chelydra serpentina TaxID=8475 RepID=A0A8T1T050_CHESE|nr:hypothetical protein G0U57_017745 [Chelydra serpentina]